MDWDKIDEKFKKHLEEVSDERFMEELKEAGYVDTEEECSPDVKNSLRKMGWDDNLIEHYVDEHKTVKIVCYTKITSEQFTNETRDSREYIYTDEA